MSSLFFLHTHKKVGNLQPEYTDDMVIATTNIHKKEIYK